MTFLRVLVLKATPFGIPTRGIYCHGITRRDGAVMGFSGYHLSSPKCPSRLSFSPENVREQKDGRCNKSSRRKSHNARACTLESHEEIIDLKPRTLRQSSGVRRTLSSRGGDRQEAQGVEAEPSDLCELGHRVGSRNECMGGQDGQAHSAKNVEREGWSFGGSFERAGLLGELIFSYDAGGAIGNDAQGPSHSPLNTRITFSFPVEHMEQVELSLLFSSSYRVSTHCVYSLHSSRRDSFVNSECV